MQVKNFTKQKGFTLIELLVSIALFSIVMTIALGAVITISDSNKKARSLMSIMNNLNFSVDSMTRSFKSGEKGNSSNGDTCFETNEIVYSGDSGSNRLVEYCWNQVDKNLTKQVQGGTAVALTSPDVTINYASFKVSGSTIKEQPLLVIILEGEVNITDKITSSFTINTSVAQRKLNI